MPAQFIIRKIMTATITLILASLMVFGALLIVPGDPVQLLLGLNNDPSAYKILQHNMGLDKPPLERYGHWVAGLARGDLGQSTSKTAPVTNLILNTIPVTMPLVILSTLLTLTIAIPAGIYAAQHKGSKKDLFITTITQLGLAIPSFWLGLLLVLVFAVGLHWLPANGWTAWTNDPIKSARSLILPVITLGLGQAAGLVRIVRSSVLDVLGQDFIRTAKGKGLKAQTIINKHVLRNAAIPIITVLGVQFGQLLTGAIVVENVFNLPGLGRLGLDAVQSTDFPLVQGVVFVIATVIVLFNVVIDVLYGVLDPRIRYE